MARDTRQMREALYSMRADEIDAAFLAFGSAEPVVNAGNKTGAATFASKAGPVQRAVLTGNVTGVTISNPTDGQRLELHLTQDGTGSRTIVWGASVVGGPTLSTGAGKLDIIQMRYRGDLSKWVVYNTAMNL